MYNLYLSSGIEKFSCRLEWKKLVLSFSDKAVCDGSTAAAGGNTIFQFEGSKK